MALVLLAPPIVPTQLLLPTARTASRRPEKAASAPATAGPAISVASALRPLAPAVDKLPDQTPQRDEFGLTVAAPAPASAAAIMQFTRPDIAGIVRELSKDLPARDKALSSDLQKRLDQRFDEAHASARPNWYQGARFEEITMAGSDGVRMYRVTTAIGTYCITYSKNGGRPTYSTCP